MTILTQFGVFPWLTALLVLTDLIWIKPDRKAWTRRSLSVLRLAALLGIGLVLPAWTMHPVWTALPVLLLLQVVTIYPLVYLQERLHLGSRILVLILYLPILMLSLTLHRLPATFTPAQAGIDWPSEPIEMRGEGGVRLAGLWFANRDAKGAVLLIHGLGAEKCQFLGTCRPLYDSGYSVMTYDQRNHGASGGWSSTMGILEARDLQQVWKVFLARTKGLEGPRLIYGVSLGGAAAQYAARALDGLDGLILDSTFADISATAKGSLPIIGTPLYLLARGLGLDYLIAGEGVLSSSPIDAIDRGSTMPVLLMHAREDPLIPSSESLRLEEAYGPRARLVLFETRGHAVHFVYENHEHRQALLDWISTL